MITKVNVRGVSDGQFRVLYGTIQWDSDKQAWGLTWTDPKFERCIRRMITHSIPAAAGTPKRWITAATPEEYVKALPRQYRNWGLYCEPA